MTAWAVRIMLIRYTNCLRWSYGFALLLIIAANSCTPRETTGKLQNPDLLFAEGEQVPGHWQVADQENAVIIPGDKVTGQKTKLVASQPGQIRLSQNVHLDSGDYFLLVRFSARLARGGFYIKATPDKHFLIDRYFKECEQVLFSLSTDHLQEV